MTQLDVSTFAVTPPATRSASIAASRPAANLAVASALDHPTTNHDWRAEARCRGEAAVDFFAPVSGETRRARAARERRAVAVCAECPVQQACLADAAGRGERYGIWGGRSFDERTSLTHQRPPTDYSLRRPA